MKESNKDIGQLFKEKLEIRDFDIPKDFLKDLDQRLELLEEKKKRRFLFFFWPQCTTCMLWGIFFGLMTAALVLGGVYYANYLGKDDHAGDVHHKSVSNKIDEKTKSTSIIKVKEKGKKEISLHQKEGINKQQTDTEKKGKDVLSVTKQSNPKEEQQWMKTPLSPTNDITETQVSEISGDVIPQNQQDNNTADEEALLSLTNQQLDIGTLPLQQYALNNPLKKEILPFASVMKPINGQKLNNSWELQLYTGGSGIQTTYTNKEYMATTEEKPVGIPFWEIGANINKNIKNFQVGIGAGYAQLNEKRTFDMIKLIVTDSLFVDWDIDTHIVYVNSVPVDTFYTEEPIYSYTYDSILTNTTVKNRMSYAIIPIQVGYRFDYKTWTFIPQIGIHLFFGKNTLQYPSADYTNLIFIDTKRFFVQYAIQLEIRKNWQSFHVFAKPIFRFSGQPFVSNDLFSRRANLYGLQLGVGYSF